MTRRLLIVAVVSLSWLLAAAPVEARPYRLLVARSPASTGAGNLEIGARYQGLYLGNGRDATAGLAAIDPGNLHQISASVRWGIISQLELGFELSGVIFHNPASGETEGAFGDAMKAPEEGFDVNDPANVSPFVAWLASSESREVSGRVWEVVGGQITAFDGYRREGTVDAGKRWDPREIGAAVKQVLADSKPLVKVYGT